MPDPKARARVRLLVAVARADGHLRDDEVVALRSALRDSQPLLTAALEDDIDIDAEIALLADDDRQAVYEAGVAIAQADRHASVDEVATLRRIWAPPPEGSLATQVLRETRDTLHPSSILPEADPSRRSNAIEEAIVKYSVLAAAAAAVPMPGVAIVADIAVVALQVKLVRDIGQVWGHKLTPVAARSLVAATAGATGMRVAVNNLARLVPGWGSAWAASSSFVATWSIGRAADSWFARGMSELDPTALRAAFESARWDANRSFEERTEEVSRGRGIHQVLAEGGVSREEWDAAAPR